MRMLGTWPYEWRGRRASVLCVLWTDMHDLVTGVESLSGSAVCGKLQSESVLKEVYQQNVVRVLASGDGGCWIVPGRFRCVRYIYLCVSRSPRTRPPAGMLINIQAMHY